MPKAGNHFSFLIPEKNSFKKVKFNLYYILHVRKKNYPANKFHVLINRFYGLTEGPAVDG